LEFLRSPTGNRLEALAGDHKGQYSVRVNDQFRLCFRWTIEGPIGIEIVEGSLALNGGGRILTQQAVAKGGYRAVGLKHPSENGIDGRKLYCLMPL
jgi:hypothetical protein